MSTARPELLQQLRAKSMARTSHDTGSAPPLLEGLRQEPYNQHFLNSHGKQALMADARQFFAGGPVSVTPPPMKPPASPPTDMSLMLSCPIAGLTSLWPMYLAASLVILFPLCFLVLRNASRGENPEQVLRERSAFLDNSKFVLITLIVASHTMHTTMFGTPMHNPTFWLYGIWVWTGWFVMPMFTFLSGMMSKGAPSAVKFHKLFVYVLMPYMLLKFVWWMIYMVAERRATLFNPLNAYAYAGVEWYLASLLTWRLLAMLLRPLPPTAHLGSALITGLGCGYLLRQSAAFALSNTLSFWPIFVCGYLVDAAALERALSPAPLRVFAGIILFGSAVAVSLFRAELGRSLLYPGFLGDLNSDYSAYYTVAQMAQPFPVGCGEHSHILWTYRLARYAIAAVLGSALLAVVPRGSIDRFSITAAGSRCIYAYLLHMGMLWLLVLAFRLLLGEARLATDTPFLEGGWIWGVITLLAACSTWIMTTKWCAAVFWPLVEPRWVEHLLQRAPRKDTADMS